MADEQVVQTSRPVNGNGAPLVPPPVMARTERTGEGDVYYTGPRPVVPPGPVVTPAVAAPVHHDRIRWASVIGGLITALTTMGLLSMLGAAIGFSVFGQGGSNGNNVGTAIAIWGAVSALVAFLLGGWVAGRTAGVETPGNAMLNGFLVGATLLIFVLWMAATGASNLFALIGNGAGGIVHTGITDPNGLGQAMTNGGLPGTPTATQASTSAWIIFGSTLIGLIAATLGGWLGWASRLPRTAVARS